MAAVASGTTCTRATEPVINKTMDRADLLTEEAMPVIGAINNLVEAIYANGLYMTSWYGTLPGGVVRPSKRGVRRWICQLLRRTTDKNEEETGIDNRGPDYEPLPNAVDDIRLPWYLYWEIYWVLRHGPKVERHMRLLDAGGASSLFSCYLASMGCEVHSVDIAESLVANGNRIAQVMGWDMFSYVMDMRRLDFEDEYFDHAYSICVFEHLDRNIKQAALAEIARCLKPSGILAITFDYRNPMQFIAEHGHDTSDRNRLMTEKDIEQSFLTSGHFELFGDQTFYDNGKSYLVHPQLGVLYTFGAIFLRKK